MLAKVDSACLVGMEGEKIQVEVNLAKGLPSFSIVGLPDASVREARDRVVAAVRNTGFEFPARRVTVNLAPAELRKEGPLFDLAMAVGILLATEEVRPSRWPRCLWLGELALDGAIRPVRGALPLVRSLTQKYHCAIVLPQSNVPEISFLKDSRIYAFSHLKEVVHWLEQEASPAPLSFTPQWTPAAAESLVDLCDIKGQSLAKRALEIAAAGHHNLLLIGPPGSGKSMLAQALPGILPLWTLDEALETAQIQSISGLRAPDGLPSCRPLRAPHHSTSSAALIGGGDVPAPGEISLSHGGILFLDELPEFRRDTLEALRQPLEEGLVHVNRARGRATFPCRFLLVAAMNPCRCGYRGHPHKECSCTLPQVQKYMGKISGPLLDRIDLHVEVPVLPVNDLFSESADRESSAAVRARVQQARDIQQKRLKGRNRGPYTNASLRGPELKKFCPISPEARELLKAAMERLGLSARAFDRICRVARTIADLGNSDIVEKQHIAEAIQYRCLDRPNHLGF